MAYAIIRPTKSTSSPPGLHGHSSSPRACATFVLHDVLSSLRLKPFSSSPIVFTPMDPDNAADSPHGCTGRGPVLAPGSPAVRRRKPRRLRHEGAMRVAIMISDTRSLWHADMIRSAAERRRGANSATGVLGVVLTTWRLASTDAGRNEALGFSRVGVSSVANRYSLWIRGTPLLGSGSVALTCVCGRHGPTLHSSRCWNLARWSHRQLKMEPQNVCQFALWSRVGDTSVRSTFLPWTA